MPVTPKFQYGHRSVIWKSIGGRRLSSTRVNPASYNAEQFPGFSLSFKGVSGLQTYSCNSVYWSPLFLPDLGEYYLCCIISCFVLFRTGLIKIWEALDFKGQ